MRKSNFCLECKLKLEDLPELLDMAPDQELTARELETLIVKLMVLRSQTEPPVETSPPSAANAHLRAPVAIPHDPDMAFSALSNGGVRLWFRHPGLGWVPVQMSLERARLLRDYLIKWAPGESPVSLVSEADLGSYLLH